MAAVCHVQDQTAAAQAASAVLVHWYKQRAAAEVVALALTPALFGYTAVVAVVREEATAILLPDLVLQAVGLIWTALAIGMVALAAVPALWAMELAMAVAGPRVVMDKS